MNSEHAEEYLGAIYRLRESPDSPLPLPRLQEYLNYTLISVHEMVRKLEGQVLISYVPYRGVILTGQGEQIAASLVRRHRIWERFLADKLAIPWEATHTIAGQLEHAAPDLVTERLADLMGDPEICPHGSVIPARTALPLTEPGQECATSPLTKRLSELSTGETAQVILISPEVPEYLVQLQGWGLTPGVSVTVVAMSETLLHTLVNDVFVEIPINLAKTLWVRLPQTEGKRD